MLGDAAASAEQAAADRFNETSDVKVVIDTGATAGTEYTTAVRNSIGTASAPVIFMSWGAASDYSVDPAAIGRMVDVTADLDRVRVRLDGRIVADHQRIWARGAVVTAPAHRETAKLLRQQFQQQRPLPVADDLSRDLADYDRASGIEGVA